MDFNRLAGLGLWSRYFNKTSEKSKSRGLDETAMKDLKIRRKRYGICLKCGQTLTDHKYCQSCSSENFQSKFNKWTSENQYIDDFIQQSQLTATNNLSYLLWILYDDLIDVKYLANGGYASVYHSTWVQSNHMIKVILKRLHNGQISNPEFLKEQVSIYLYGGSNNSNIVRCYGFTKHPTEGYMLVLEYAEDNDIRSFLHEQSSNLLWLDKLLILRDVSKSLDLLHSYEFVHGDLHTGNVLKKHPRKNSTLPSIKNKKRKGIYDPNARETIIDIPLCFDDSDISESYAPAQPYGVIPYVAPEVFEKGYYTKQSDIYSFGIVMWEISTNLSPFFDYTNDKALVSDILQGVRPEIEDQPIPKCVISLIEQCWDSHPFNRPSAKSITNMLNEWIWILSTPKIRLSSKSKSILKQFSTVNDTTKNKKVKRPSKLPASLSRTPTLLRNTNYYSKSLSKYLITMDVEKSANASSFVSSFSSTDTIVNQRQQDYYL